MSMNCPHCGETMHIRSSRETSLISREIYYRCTNLHCGHIAIAITELIKTIVPAQFPNPKCHLPVIKPESSAPPRG
ncbi:ogr/Delta-like zinc finger family protein [Deefgea sp. CFH1-16]|uniref:ogr/Delta-like zinc finger family protein n=1 Tax=Deefgea sp. CFH1-16 TaxID=2675457 RepID=UPI0015F49915|nr:ogr/Delta-like zinc finger family protein [Deefgea sp. CFH1-16]MBM5575592.1 transcriptional regulator [Deefgea sp. CFH1-16]